MRERLFLISRLLRPYCLIFVYIDDSEGAYLKVLMDEVFDRASLDSAVRGGLGAVVDDGAAAFGSCLDR